MQVKATAGDTHLGGEDFDNRLVNHFVQVRWGSRIVICSYICYATFALAVPVLGWWALRLQESVIRSCLAR